MELPSVHFALPSPSLFQFPPKNNPQTLRPPSIPLFYHEALDIIVPITASCFYAAAVHALNAFNRANGGKPWRIVKTKIFFYLVVTHNILLTIYSTWTFVGMFGALRRTVQSPAGSTGLAGFVDSLCKIHGTAGLGNGIIYHPATSQWVYGPPSSVDDRSPSLIDQGRLWNEGLSFYGWMFYWSKIYEFFDTFIIITKGKQESILQVYHHIGALICTWAGIRYMSSPIWIPTFVNSGIHCLMYTYYTLTAFGIPIPRILKKSLTIMQIIQLVLSDLLAALYLLISYTFPINIRDAATPSASSRIAFPFSWAGLRNVQSALQYRMHTVPCIDTSGQAFAAWLSVLYLTPLIGLFIRFYIQNYGKGTSGEVRGQDGERSKKKKHSRL